MVAIDTQTATAVSRDVLGAILEASPHLGCDPDRYYQYRTSPAVRRAIAEQHIHPSIVVHDTVVNYDDANNRDFQPNEYYRVHDALTSDHFTVPRRGQHRVQIAEIRADCSLSVACQRRLLEVLRFRRTCFAEARHMLNSVLRADYPIMAHCGEMFRWRDEVDVIPCLHQVESGRFLEANRLMTRYAQTYRLLAVVED